jgi:hypothetical protein
VSPANSRKDWRGPFLDEFTALRREGPDVDRPRIRRRSEIVPIADADVEAALERLQIPNVAGKALVIVGITDLAGIAEPLDMRRDVQGFGKSGAFDVKSCKDYDGNQAEPTQSGTVETRGAHGAAHTATGALMAGCGS